MTSIIKSLIAKTRRNAAQEEAETLNRATQVLQSRVQQLMGTTVAHDRAAA